MIDVETNEDAIKIGFCDECDFDRGLCQCNKTPTVDENKMSPKQIENFRRVLTGMIGTYALLMPAEEIQRYKDSLQHQIDKIST